MNNILLLISLTVCAHEWLGSEEVLRRSLLSNIYGLKIAPLASVGYNKWRLARRGFSSFLQRCVAFVWLSVSEKVVILSNIALRLRLEETN